MDKGKNIAMEIINVSRKYDIGLCVGISEYEEGERKGLWYLWVQLLIGRNYIMDSCGEPNVLVLDDEVEELVAFDKFVTRMLVSTDGEAQNYHDTIGRFSSLRYSHNQIVYELKQKLEEK